MYGIEHIYTGGYCRPTRVLRVYVPSPIFPFIADILAKSVVLTHRPPISLPRTTVPPAILEELLSEIGSLASVYHKPADTFIGKARMGVDAVKKSIFEYVFLPLLPGLLFRGLQLTMRPETKKRPASPHCKRLLQASNRRTSSTSTTRPRSRASRH